MTGTTCLWYPLGDKAEQPRVAFVVGPHPPNDRNMLDLAVVLPANGHLEPMRHVRHVDDPHLQAHRQLAVNNGGWDFCHPDGRNGLDEKTVSTMLARLVPALVADVLSKQRKADKP